MNDGCVHEFINARRYNVRARTLHTVATMPHGSDASACIVRI